MKTFLRASTAAALLALPLLAQAQAKAEPVVTISGNAALVSDYRFRGMTQTDYGPGYQGGFDLAFRPGFYVGNWNANVEQNLFTGASLEMDFYGGYKHSFGDFGLDVGVLYYAYPKSGANGQTKIDNTELYIGGSWGPASVKYSHAVSDFFGIDGTKNSYYLEANVAFEVVPNLTLGGHVGYQKVKGLPSGSIDDNVDYKLGLTYSLDGWALGANLIANSEKNFAITGNDGEAAGKTRVVLSVGKSF